MRIFKKILKIILILLVVIAAAVTAFLNFAPSMGGSVAGERLARAEQSEYYKDGAFKNILPPTPTEPGWVWDQIDKQFFGDEQRYPPAPIPMVKVAEGAFDGKPDAGLRAIWLGHASTYLEIDGIRILIDPVFSDYVSPLQGLGPKRFHPSPLKLGALPKVDAVLITHDHYDHLDMATVKELAAKDARFYVPLGVGAHLERWDIPVEQIVEMEWGQQQSVRRVKIVSTPSRHYSGRGLTNRNETFWSSWAIIGPDHRAYISGDTGYSDHFRKTGTEHGPFDLSIVKIGAYGPGAAWTDVHMSAEDAVQAHIDLKAKEMLPVHWGTFNLGFHDWNEPIKRTLAAAEKKGAKVHAPRVGEIVESGPGLVFSIWWNLDNIAAE